MDFRAVRYFEQVAESGSIQAAAARLRVAGSAISRTIVLLERELGVELFVRARTGMTLTAAGEICLRYARGVSLERDRLRSEIEELRGLRRGHIRLASVEGVVADLVVRAITDFRWRFPAITFGLRVAGSNIVANAVANRDAEIGVGASGTYSHDITVTLRAATPLRAIISPQLKRPRRRRGPMSLAEITAMCAIALPDESFAIRRQLDECAAASSLRLSPTLVTNSVDALRTFARLGCGATFLPSIAVLDDLQRGRLLSIPLTDADLNASSVEVVTAAHGRQLPPASMEFLKHLTGIITQCPQ